MTKLDQKDSKNVDVLFVCSEIYLQSTMIENDILGES